MKRWRGLVQKEWAHMKWRLVFFALINNLLLFWGVSHLVLGVPEGFLTSIQPMIGICFTLHIIMAVSLLFDSLGKDIGRPDIWLHSPATMRQLVGAKFSLISLAIVCSLCVMRHDCRYLLFCRRRGNFRRRRAVFIADCGRCHFVECHLCHGTCFFLLVDLPSIPFPDWLVLDYRHYCLSQCMALWMGNCLVHRCVPVRQGDGADVWSDSDDGSTNV